MRVFGRKSAEGQVDTFNVPQSWEVTGDFIRGNTTRVLYAHWATMSGLNALSQYSYRVGCEGASMLCGSCSECAVIL